MKIFIIFYSILTMHDLSLYKIKKIISCLKSIYDILISNTYFNRKISNTIYILNKSKSISVTRVNLFSV